MIGPEPRGLTACLEPWVQACLTWNLDCLVMWHSFLFFFFCALQLKEGNSKSPEEQALGLEGGTDPIVGVGEGSYIKEGRFALT